MANWTLNRTPPAAPMEAVTPCPPVNDANGPDWPLERWTGPLYALGGGRPARRPARRWEGWMTVIVGACAGLAALVSSGDGLLAALGLVIGLGAAGAFRLRRPARRWLEGRLTPSVALREPVAAPVPIAVRRARLVATTAAREEEPVEAAAEPLRVAR
jgi:hypothetical protein